MNKFILLLGLPILLSFQTDNHPITRIIFGNNLEVMNGNVKQLINIQGFYSPLHKDHIIYRDTFNFDRRGDIIDIRSVNSGDRNYHGDKKFHIVYSYKYDHNGKSTETVANTIGHGSGKFIYGKDGRITEELSYDEKGVLWGTASYKYDTLGNVVEYEYQHIKDKSIQRHEYKYDKKNIAEEISSREERTYNISYQYKTFDSKNNWTQLVKVAQDPNDRFGFIHRDTVYRQIIYY